VIDLPPPPPSYEQTIQAIEACGVVRSTVRVKYEDLLQSDEVTISDIGEVTDSKLRCIRQAVHPFYILTLEKAQQQSAFFELAQNDDRPAQLRTAREWADAQGKTAQVPIFKESEGVAGFVNALERACDLKTGSVFVADGGRFLALQPQMFTPSNFKQSAKVMERVMQIFAASNANEHGIRFGFIGNQAVAEEKK
jgi:hypothetical protein